MKRRDVSFGIRHVKLLDGCWVAVRQGSCDGALGISGLGEHRGGLSLLRQRSDLGIQRRRMMPRCAATMAALVRSLTPNFERICFMWPWTVSSLMERAEATSLLR
jgi:hypothetical protein